MAAHQHVDCPEIPIALLELPPFSTVAVKVLQLVASNVSELKALSNLIGSDPAFAGAILRIINSPLFGMRKQISSVFDATVLLGLERIKGVALTIGIRTYLHETLEVPAIKACWRHSLACAMIAGELARGSEVKEDVAFTAGVIHDIGRLALAVAFPHRYPEFLTTGQLDPCDALEREREMFGIDHCRAGRELVSRWNLPETFVGVTSRHHEPMVPGEMNLLEIIRASCIIADILGFDAILPAHQKKYADLLAGLPKKFRSRLPSDPADLTFVIAFKINSIEST